MFKKMSICFRELSLPTVCEDTLQHILSYTAEKTRRVALGVLSLSCVSIGIGSCLIYAYPEAGEVLGVMKTLFIVGGTSTAILSSIVLCDLASSSADREAAQDELIELSPMSPRRGALQRLGLIRQGPESFAFPLLQVWTLIPQLRDTLFEQPPLTEAQILFQTWALAVLHHRNREDVPNPFKIPPDILYKLHTFPSDCLLLKNLQRMILPPNSPFHGSKITIQKRERIASQVRRYSGTDAGLLEMAHVTEDTDIQTLFNRSCVREGIDSHIETLYTSTPQMLCLEMHPLEAAGALLLTPLRLKGETYELIGGTCHHLSHDIACIRNEEGEWLLCEDDHVDLASEEIVMNLLSNHATLLYYIHK